METTVAKPVNPVREKRQQLYQKYLEEVRNARAMGKKIVYCTNAAPVEFFRAMDYVPIFPSNVSATCSAAKVSTQMCEAAEAEGYRSDLCSYGRTGIGDILLGERSPSPYGQLPKPDAIVTGCHDHIMIKWFEQLSRYFDAPMFVIDVPFTHDNITEEDKKKAEKYIAEQLLELIDSLSKITDHPFNWDRAHELLAATQKSQELWQETLALRQNNPSPFSAWDLFIDLLFPIRVFRGLPDPIDFYTMAKTHYEEKIKQGIGAIPNEKYRLHFNGLPAWFRMGWLAKTLTAHGAVPLTGVYGFSSRFETLDMSNPIESMAAALRLSFVLEGTMSKANHIIWLINRYSLDGVLMMWSQTCRAFTVDMRDIMEIVEQKTGAPSVMIQCDTCDSRLMPPDESTLNTVETFVEILAARKRKG